LSGLTTEGKRERERERKEKKEEIFVGWRNP